MSVPWSVMATPDSAPPWMSVMVPVMLPPASCACGALARNTTHTSDSKRCFMLSMVDDPDERGLYGIAHAAEQARSARDGQVVGRKLWVSLSGSRRQDTSNS